ncbi:restriction endonuclease subunit S [Moraxellaceae bacterium AER2_44_116]|nr:restriction endonuclease subunit S [Moraxellaceae bacterium AER2_44_116]
MKFNQMILDDILTFKRGHDLPHSQRVMGEIPVVSSSGITGFHNEYICDGEGVITGRYGTLGEIHYVNGKYWPLNTTLYVTDFKSNFPKFIYFFLKTIDFEGANSAGAVPGINRNNLKNIVVKIPDLETQKKIASILSNYDDLIQTNQQRIALLEEAAQRLYDEWFVKLRFPNHEQVPVVDGVPEGWERGSIYDFADILSGGTPNTKEPNYWGGDIPFFTPKDSPDSFFVFNCEKSITKIGLKSCNSRLYLEDSIFITARGTVGKICLAGVPMAMNQSCYSVKPKENFSPYYFYLALQKSVAQIKQTANGGVFDAIIVDTFRSIDMVRPNFELSQRFSMSVKPFFDQIKTIIIQNQKLAQARDALLPRLMSGKMDVSGLSLKGIA